LAHHLFNDYRVCADSRLAPEVSKPSVFASDATEVRCSWCGGPHRDKGNVVRVDIRGCPLVDKRQAAWVAFVVELPRSKTLNTWSAWPIVRYRRNVQLFATEQS